MKVSVTCTQWILISVLVLATLPYFISLGSSSLSDSNEAFYAETPREMIESGDYVNPTFNYHPRLNKPPLSYWIVAVSYKVFGVSEAAERLPIALAAIVLIATAYGLGHLAFSTEAGLLAAICLAIAPRFLMFSRRIMIDVWLAMFMAVALLMFALAERFPRRRRVCLVLMYASLGLGVITKGPVAVVLPAIAIVIYLAVHRSLGSLREMMLPLGFVIVAALVLPWYLAIYSRHGWDEIETFIVKDNLSRFAQHEWGPRRGVLFYVSTILNDLFPWSVFFVPLLWFGAARIWAALRARRARSELPPGQNRMAALPAIWIGVIVVFFSLSRSKEDLYVLPIYPAASALIGGLLARCFTHEPLTRHRAVRWVAFALSASLAGAGAVLLYASGRTSQLVELGGALVLGSIGVIGGLTGAATASLNKTRWAVVITALTVGASNWIIVSRTIPDFERYKPVRPLCEIIAAEAGPDSLVGYYRVAYPSMVYYLRRPIFEYSTESEIIGALSSAKEVYCVMTDLEYEAIRAKLPAVTRVLATRPTSQVKLKRVFDRTDQPRVVLISNKGGTE